MDESPIHQYRIWDLECKLIVEDLKVDLKTEAEKATGGDTNQKKAFCDLEPIYTYEGTYDINTLVTGREITGVARCFWHELFEDCPGDLSYWYRHISKGVWPFSTVDHGWPISDCIAEGLKAALSLSKIPADVVGEPVDVNRLYDGVNVILSLQACTMAKRANTKRKRTFRTSATTLPNEEPDRGNDSPLGATYAVVDTTQRNVRKGTQMHFLWGMKAGNKLDVELDGEGRPINDGGSDYSRFLGTIARHPYLFPISYLRWDNISDENIDSVCTQEIEPRFHFFPAEHSLDIKKLSIKQLNDKWRQWKHDLKDKHFDYSKSDEANVKVIEAKEPDRVDVDQYLILVRHWLSNEGKAKKYGIMPCRGRIYTHTRKNKKNEYVNTIAEAYGKLFDKKQEAREAREKAREENPKLAEVFGISDNDSELDNELDNDDYTEIKGKSKRGRLNCSRHRPNSIKNVASGSDLARKNSCDLAAKVVLQAEERVEMKRNLPNPTPL
ncbi:hypothetical protein ACFE04_011239 [Oxalis oulophora]